MAQKQTFEIPIAGMDCAECTAHVQDAIAKLPGVESVQVFLSSEKATVRLDPTRVDLPTLRQAVAGAGYSVPDAAAPAVSQDKFTRRLWTFLGVVFGVILFIVIVGEWFGLFDRLTERVPFPIGLAIVAVGGFPIFRNVLRAALQRQVISHTLMTLGAIAALAIGEWATALVIVFFMRVGDYAKHFTTESARRAVRDLTAMAPQTARVEREGVERDLPIGQVQMGDVVVVRPGETIPVDGEVLDGQARSATRSIRSQKQYVPGRVNAD